MMEQPDRVDWVDYAKGFCIVMVVMMHSTLGVGEAMSGEGFLHDVVAFAKPFRMPDFFLIAGLFLARVIERDWVHYLDRKVIHFVYFYLLWASIQLILKQSGLLVSEPAAFAGAFLMTLVEPFGTLWFIHLLPIFFVVTKLMRRVPPLLVFVAAAALQIGAPQSGWLVIDEFCARYVYFFAGYAAAPFWFALADWVRARIATVLPMLAGWALLNGAGVTLGFAELPFVSLALGFLGAGAVITGAALLAEARRLRVLRYFGTRSLVIYLAFFLPMAATRVALVKFGVVEDIGLASAIVTVVALVVPLVLFVLARRTPACFLFARPACLHVAGSRNGASGPVWGPFCPLPRIAGSSAR